ncbi:MAG: ABC transporter substrate-binding protein [Gammaproteobacteria bacterium]|nr:ABC transporter substrate-binding protein [Gammaproteobacteria bacterium]NIR88865.1 ABC transporter substrate-binding protein [Gammaproteobacteria bacterium]NIU06469.1 ABC transporter substrate-binding protein [Gammaproteobacteria bacterium]NIV53361.1 ABC transporter substrate-binding protein [Gammaproteobacteria bacterium]NIV74080.1 ABC transporter substrate-binding protein [Gammaproteobacteria bacterium]
MNTKNSMRKRIDRRTLIKGAGAIAGLAALPGMRIRLAHAQEEINIGFLMPLTGAGGTEGPDMLKAAQGAVDEINRQGGPLGRRIRIFSEDSQTDAETGVRAAKKLIEVNRVSAILGTWASATTLAVAPVAQAAEVVEMSTSGASRITEIQKGGFVYRTEPDDLLFGKAYAEMALQRGWKRASVLGLNVPFTTSTVAAFQERFESGGGKVLSFTTYNAEQTTFKAETIKAFEGDPDFIHISGYQPDVTGILRAAYQANLRGRFVVPFWTITTSTIANLGPAAEGVIIVAEGVNEDSPGYAVVKRILPGAGYHPHPAQTYDMVHLVALAIEASKDASGIGINSTLRRVSGPPGTPVSSFLEGAQRLRAGEEVDYQGASGPIDFDENGNIVKANFQVSEIQNGKITPTGLLEDVVF